MFYLGGGIYHSELLEPRLLAHHAYRRSHALSNHAGIDHMMNFADDVLFFLPYIGVVLEISTGHVKIIRFVL